LSSGDRTPSFKYALEVGDLFGIDPGRLARAEFPDVLELADAERFRKAEETLEQPQARRIRRAREGRPDEVVPMKSKAQVEAQA
jgi:hypothetical protein